MFSRPVLKRVSPAPVELVDYVGLFNLATGCESVPSAAVAPPDLVADVECAIRALPPVVTKLLQSVLLGVYFARGLGSSAITHVVGNAQGEVIGAAVALDVDAVTSRTANAWASWKENTPFVAGDAVALEVRIAGPEADTRSNAIQFLLLHEFGHVLTAGKGFLPDWWLALDPSASTEDYPFLRLAWQIGADRTIVPKAGDDFPGRAHPRFYGEPQLDADHVLALYHGLLSSSFVTLYASTNAYDDFAESFASYVHCVLMRKPYRVSVSCDGVLALASDEYWSSPRSGPKRAFMEGFFATL